MTNLPFETNTASGAESVTTPVREEVVVRVHTAQGPRRVQAEALSLTGMYLSGVRAPIGREVGMRIALPDEAEDLLVRGRVVRSDDGSHVGVAMTFSHIGWEDLLCIARYLAPRL